MFKIVAFPMGLVLVVNCTSDWKHLNFAVKFWWKNASMSSVSKCRAISDVDDTFSSSAPQLFMSFGLLSYFFPLFPLLHPLFPVLHSHLSQVISRVVFPS
jgi:hypothetical protein